MAEYRFIIWRKYEELETLGYAMILKDNEVIFKFNTIELPMFTIPLKPNTVCTNCIPAGTYKAGKIYSPTKGQCFKVYDVEGRTAILIHKGNFATGKKVDTQGCILVGKSFKDINNDNAVDVCHSTTTMKTLLSILPDEYRLIIC